MKIVNCTNFYDISINGHTVKPSEEIIVPENIFSSRDIHSDVGSVEIITEYCKRIFRNYGNLKAYESEEKDDEGYAIIYVIHTIPQNLYKRAEVTSDAN